MFKFGILHQHPRLPNRHLIVGYTRPTLGIIGGDLIHVSGSSTNYLGDDDTYQLPDDANYRTYSGWENGVDHVLFTSTGEPKVVTGSVLKNFGSSPTTFFAGGRGVLVYSSPQTGEDALKILDYLKVVINTIYLIDNEGNFLVSSGNNLTIGA